MANTLGNYSPIFYANEALMHLRNALGMAQRVHRGYELERRSFQKGNTISIRKPSTFVAQDPISSDQDLDTETVDILLTSNPGVRFKLTDVELAYTQNQIIEEHIQPAAYAIANKIDQDLAALYKNVPWLYDYGTATDHTIITGAQKVMFDRAAFMDDGNMHMMVDGLVRSYFQNSTTFHAADVTGPGNNDTLFRGSLGTRFGVEVFGNQNTPTHTPGTAAGGGDAVGAINGALAKGATSIAVDGFTGAETILAGDTFVIAGNTQRYAVTSNVTLSTGAGTVNFTPAAVQAYADDSVMTLGSQTATAHSQQLMFHRNAFALALAPLPQNLPGIEAFTAVHADSGLAVRARRWSVGLTATTYVALDVLYGVKTLDPNLAVRAWT